MTVLVIINDNNIIIDAAPIVRKFIGQPFSNLVRWMKPDVMEPIPSGSVS